MKLTLTSVQQWIYEMRQPKHVYVHPADYAALAELMVRYQQMAFTEVNEIEFSGTRFHSIPQGAIVMTGIAGWQA